MTVPQPQPGYGQPAAPQNTLGLVSLILGIASIVLACCFGAGIVIGAVAAVLGYMGKQKAAQGLATNGSQANLGFILGIVGAGLSLLLIILSTAFSFSTIPFN